MPKSLITVARQHLGQRETPGPKSNNWIERMWQLLPGGGWFWRHYGSDDSKLPWCGAFLALVCQEAGHSFPKNYASAAAWAAWGVKVKTPRHGCVAVLSRAGGGHVGIVTGHTPDGRYIRLLGGNQGDAVSEAWFGVDRVTALRKPDDRWLPPAELAQVGSLSTSEA